MRLVFRADASHRIGTGHVMRCAAVIEEAQTRDFECVLVGNLGGIVWLENYLSSLRVKVITSADDFRLKAKYDTLILDSYSIPKFEPFIQAENWKSVIVISDDSTPKYLADLVIHLSLSELNNEGINTRHISGSKFIPFRKSIQKSKNPVNIEVKKVLIFAGGTDQLNFAWSMANGLAHIHDFVQAVFISNLSDEITSIDPRFVTRPFGSAIDLELLDADIVFTTASTSSLEIIAREIPLGICYAADNQVPYFNNLVQRGLAIDIGKIETNDRWNLNWERIGLLLSDYSVRKRILKNAEGFFDLQGARRIVDEIVKI